MSKAAKRVVDLTAAMVTTKAAARSAPAVGAPTREGGAGDPLNFRVSPEFRRRFRMFAAEHNMRLSAVLAEAFEALIRERGEGR